MIPIKNLAFLFFLALFTLQCTGNEPTTEENTAQVPGEEQSAEQEAIAGEVPYSASGNEPFWNIQIKPGEAIVFSNPEGTSTLPYVEPVMDKSARPAKRYKVETEATKLQLIIYSGRPCTNSMNGKDFPDTVEALVNGKEYQGCGGPVLSI